MKIFSLIILLVSFHAFSFNTKGLGKKLRAVNYQIPFTFKITLGDIGPRDSVKIDSIYNAKQVHAYRVDQLGNAVECEIIKGSVTVTGVARIGQIERGGKLSNSSIFNIQNSTNRYVMIYTEFLYKTDTIIKSLSFNVIP